MERRVSPCKGCKDRSPECHGKCEKYNAWKDAEHEHKIELMRKRYPEMYRYIVSRRHRGRNNGQR